MDVGRGTVYEAAGGRAGLERLAAAWHERVVADELVGHAFRHGADPHHTQRLAAYWGEALGGPPAYSQTYGDESAVVRMHSGNGPHLEMNQRAVGCFDAAMADVGLVPTNTVREVLRTPRPEHRRRRLATLRRSSRDEQPQHLRGTRRGMRGNFHACAVRFQV